MKEQTAQKRQEEPRDPWQVYEERKAELPNDLSPAEYLTACRKIAEELGI